MGDLCRALKEYDLALNYYKMIPDSISCQIKLANIYEKKNDIDNMTNWYKKAADNGDLESCFKLATIYERTGNPKGAIRYYQIAAEHGHDIAKLYAGRLFFLEANYEEAKRYLEGPAQLNNIYALNTMGVMYDNFFKDPKKAIEYYEKAANLKCTESMYNLAQLLFRLYEYDKAERYLKLGTEYGNKRCEYFLAAFYYRKSMDMFKALSNISYENTSELSNDIKILNFIDDHLLMTDFKVSPLMYEELKEDVEPLYIIDIQEDITQYIKPKEVRMAVDQGEVEDLDI